MALIDWLQSRLDELSTAFFATLAFLVLLGAALFLRAFRWGDGTALDEDDEDDDDPPINGVGAEA